CCRRIRHLLTDERLRQGILAAERYAEGQEQWEGWVAATDAFGEAHVDTCDPYDGTPHQQAADAVAYLVHWRPEDIGKVTTWPEALPAGTAADAIQGGAGRDRRALSREYQAQSELLRCLVGNPFRPVPFNPAWVTPTVKAMAKSIYDDRTFADLPVLADALEE